MTVSEVISAGGEKERQTGPRTKLGSSPSEAREAGGVPELTGDSPPSTHPQGLGAHAWRPADLRPLPGGQSWISQCRCLSEAHREKPALGLCTLQAPDVPGGSHVSKATLRTEVQM